LFAIVSATISLRRLRGTPLAAVRSA